MDFTNRYRDDPIHLIKSIAQERKFENVNMPAESMKKLREFLLKQYLELKSKSVNKATTIRISKVLGK